MRLCVVKDVYNILAASDVVLRRIMLKLIRHVWDMKCPAQESIP
jgi:hypothetical protein